MWVRIEVVSLGVGIYILYGSSGSQATVRLKYLILQMLIRAVVIVRIVYTIEFVLVFGLSFKLRVIPGCMWVVDIFTRFDLIYCWLVSTVTKVFPFLILWEHVEFFDFRLVALASIVIRSFWRLNFSDVRQVLACSSVINIRWLCSLFICDEFYYLILSFFIYVFLISGFFIIITLTHLLGIGKKGGLIISFLFFRIIRLPSFSGFYVKFVIVLGLLDYKFLFFIYLISYRSVVIYIRMFNMRFVRRRGSTLVSANINLSIISSLMVVIILCICFFIFI